MSVSNLGNFQPNYNINLAEHSTKNVLIANPTNFKTTNYEINPMNHTPTPFPSPLLPSTPKNTSHLNFQNSLIQKLQSTTTNNPNINKENKVDNDLIIDYGSESDESYDTEESDDDKMDIDDDEEIEDQMEVDHEENEENKDKDYLIRALTPNVSVASNLGSIMGNEFNFVDSRVDHSRLSKI
ncbi:hypothetical protein KGF54_000491 [Candida jiufengensis]|uniref:uncharacterized protein n=1 Tax=Candida jiufengensis TaxID=497108 RepID=UPI002224FF07|nr:uncharacterized protein KGF54_000491 [Candida jiufengensis]KAI5956873.1 hypothetical protein KGF54_000491 [Candida jiufengensis]